MDRIRPTDRTHGTDRTGGTDGTGAHPCLTEADRGLLDGMREHRQWWPWRRGPAWGRRRVRGGGTVWPLAVGVVLVPQDFTAATRLEQRLALALGAYRRAAYRRGFFLLDLLDVPAWAVNPTRGWAPVWELADRTVPDAVIVYGGTSSEVPKPPGGLRGLPVHVLPPERP